jgi:hypothetical protein
VKAFLLRPFLISLVALSFLMMNVGSAQITEVTQMIPPEGGRIELESCGYIEFPEDFLKEETKVTYSCTDITSDDYPENFEDLSWGDRYEPISKVAVIELPASAITINLDDLKTVIRVWLPAIKPYFGLGMAEIRYQFGDEELFGIDQYRADDPKFYPSGAASEVVRVRRSELSGMIEAYAPTMFTISVVAKGLKPEFQNPPRGPND